MELLYSARRRCLFMALFGHAVMSELSLLSSVNRTSRLRPSTSDFDPNPTWRPPKICHGTAPNVFWTSGLRLHYDSLV